MLAGVLRDREGCLDDMRLIGKVKADGDQRFMRACVRTSAPNLVQALGSFRRYTAIPYSTGIPDSLLVLTEVYAKCLLWR